MLTTIRRPAIKRCPYKDETDIGEIEINFDGPAPELHELDNKINALCANAISHEDFTAGIAALVPDAIVKTTWQTGSWSVEVTENR
jgi:hypothetical protein